VGACVDPLPCWQHAPTKRRARPPPGHGQRLQQAQLQPGWGPGRATAAGRSSRQPAWACCLPREPAAAEVGAGALPDTLRLQPLARQQVRCRPARGGGGGGGRRHAAAAAGRGGGAAPALAAAGRRRRPFPHPGVLGAPAAAGGGGRRQPGRGSGADAAAGTLAARGGLRSSQPGVSGAAPAAGRRGGAAPPGLALRCTHRQAGPAPRPAAAHAVVQDGAAAAPHQPAGSAGVHVRAAAGQLPPAGRRRHGGGRRRPRPCTTCSRQREKPRQAAAPARGGTRAASPASLAPRLTWAPQRCRGTRGRRWHGLQRRWRWRRGGQPSSACASGSLRHATRAPREPTRRPGRIQR
jgi:hypothetical protein